MKKLPRTRLAQVQYLRKGIRMNNDIFIPEVGTTCNALLNENYETMLSGECHKFCTCAITIKGGKPTSLDVGWIA